MGRGTELRRPLAAFHASLPTRARRPSGGKAMGAFRRHSKRALRWRWVLSWLLLAILLLMLVRAKGRNPLLSTVALSYQPGAVVVDAHSGRAFITTVDSESGASLVAVLATTTGKLVHTVSAQDSPDQLAVDEQAGRVFAIGAGWVLNILDARDGTVLRTVTFDVAPTTMAVDARGGRVFVAHRDGTISVLDARRGHVVDTIALGGSIASLAVDERAGRLLVTRTTGNTEPTRRPGMVSLIAMGSGRVLRTVPVGRLPGDVAVDEASGRAFIASPLHSGIKVLDIRSGRLYTIGLPGPALSLAVDAQTARVFAVVAAGGSIGHVYVLDARSGRVLAAPAVGVSPWIQAVDTRRGRVFVVNTNTNSAFAPRGRGSISVLDARDGAVLRTVAVGVLPTGVAVDEQTGHVVVTSIGGSIPVVDPWSWVPRPLRRWLPFLAAPIKRAHTEPGSVSVLDGTS